MDIGQLLSNIYKAYCFHKDHFAISLNKMLMILFIRTFQNTWHCDKSKFDVGDCIHYVSTFQHEPENHNHMIELIN